MRTTCSRGSAHRKPRPFASISPAHRGAEHRPLTPTKSRPLVPIGGLAGGPCAVIGRPRGGAWRGAARCRVGAGSVRAGPGRAWRCCWSTNSGRCRQTSRSRRCPSWRPWRTCRPSSVRAGRGGCGTCWTRYRTAPGRCHPRARSAYQPRRGPGAPCPVPGPHPGSHTPPASVPPGPGSHPPVPPPVPPRSPAPPRDAARRHRRVASGPGVAPRPVRPAEQQRWETARLPPAVSRERTGRNGAERGRAAALHNAALYAARGQPGTGRTPHGATLTPCPRRLPGDAHRILTRQSRPGREHQGTGGAPPHARGCGTGARPWAPTRTPHLCALAENPGRLRLQPQQVQNAAEHPGGGEGDARRCLAQDGRDAGADVAEEVTMFVHRPWAQPGMWGWGSRRARGQSATPHRLWGSKAQGHCTSLPLPAGG